MMIGGRCGINPMLKITDVSVGTFGDPGILRVVAVQMDSRLFDTLCDDGEDCSTVILVVWMESSYTRVPMNLKAQR